MRWPVVWDGVVCSVGFVSGVNSPTEFAYGLTIVAPLTPLGFLAFCRLRRKTAKIIPAVMNTTMRTTGTATKVTNFGPLVSSGGNKELRWSVSMNQN